MNTEKYNDARIIGAFDINDPRYNKPLTIMIAKGVKATSWAPSKIIPDVKAGLDAFSRHPKSKSKDGLGYFPGKMIPGPRNKNAVEKMHFMVFDFDHGPHDDEIDAKTENFGRTAVRHTSFSNGKTRSEFSRGAVMKCLKCRKDDINTEAMRRFAREQLTWADELVATIELVECKQVSSGFKCFIKHAPISKNRLIYPLDVPFVADDYEDIQAAAEAWRAYYFAVADLLGLRDYIDESGARLNQMFYFPRHPEGMAHDTTIMGGPLLDLRDVKVEKTAAKTGAKKAKAITPEGLKLVDWAREYKNRFQAADACRDYCDEMIFGQGTAGYDIECPFEGGHSNPKPNDRACFVVNAGEGHSTPNFIFSCRHNSCDGYTNLDHLGKLLADGRFDREVITSEDYNSLPDDATSSNGSNVVQVSTDNAVAATESRGEIVVADGYGGALAFVEKSEPIPKGVSYDKETGQIHSSYRNALLLIGFEKWDLGYNELTQDYGMRGEVEYPWPNHLGYALNDAIRREIRLYMLRRWSVTFKPEDIYEASMTLARRNAFNPVCDYLDEVEPQWDGTPRVDCWLETYMGVKVTDANAAFVHAIGKIVLVAAVRRAREPGCKFDEMLILEGLQGGGKSTAVRILGGDWFGDANLGDLGRKDARMKLRGVWLQENAELAGLTRAEVDELKEFMSQQFDRYRIPYAKSEEDFPRRCVFIGTVNPGGGAYLVDLTGNRRFWPVACGLIDLEALAGDRDQLWAEAAMMESRGDSIRLDPSLYGAAKAEQDARLADDPWIEILAEYLDTERTIRGKTRVLSMNLLAEALELPTEKKNQTAMKKLKNVMALIPNWNYEDTLRVDGLRSAGYKYVPPADQAE